MSGAAPTSCCSAFPRRQTACAATSPFQPLWERVQKEAFITTEDGRKSLEANWAALSQAIALSPDLTDPQREALDEEYFQKATRLREGARKRGFRADELPDPDEAIRARSFRGFGS